MKVPVDWFFVGSLMIFWSWAKGQATCDCDVCGEVFTAPLLAEAGTQK